MTSGPPQVSIYVPTAIAGSLAFLMVCFRPFPLAQGDTDGMVTVLPEYQIPGLKTELSRA